MLHALCLLLLTSILAMLTFPTTAMPEQQAVQARIVHYNTQASLLYEQAFFLELLIATLASRRYDEFNADVALAHSRITTQVISSIEHRELPFDDDIPPHEIFSLSNIYYVCMYLINQNTFHKLCNELLWIRQHHELKLLTHMLTLLLAFIEHHKISPSCSLSYLNSQAQNFIQLIQYYQRECPSLRTSYTEYVRILREQVICYGGATQHLFHKYFKPQQKFLPLLLDSSTEPMLYTSVMHDATVYLYEYNQTMDMKQPAKKRKSEDSTPQIPVMQFMPCLPHFLRNHHDLFTAYDYQEYLASHIAHVIEKPDELPLFLQDFFISYRTNHEALQYLFAHSDEEHNILGANSLVPLQEACKILQHIQEHPATTKHYIQELKTILEKHYQERIAS